MIPKWAINEEREAAPVHAIKLYREAEVWLHSLLISAQD
jgi:hypothetical protein